MGGGGVVAHRPIAHTSMPSATVLQLRMPVAASSSPAAARRRASSSRARPDAAGREPKPHTPAKTWNAQSSETSEGGPAGCRVAVLGWVCVRIRAAVLVAESGRGGCEKQKNIR